ncbi:MAG: hypothetical protein QW085_04120 [Pyrobaculum sp.]
MDFRNFIINHVDRVLEYLEQSPLVVYTRRTVDAYLAAYAIISTFGETAHVSIVDWPPESGFCMGFKCNGLYITEWEVGVDDSVYKTEFTSLSYLTYVLLSTLSPVDDKVKKALYIGHYSWGVDLCEYKCPIPSELLIGDERLRVVFPFIDQRPPLHAIVNSTLPIVPGAFGRATTPPLEDSIAVLDWALGTAAAEGFHTSVVDKAVRLYSPTVKPAEAAVGFEAILAGFINDIDKYIVNLMDNFYTVLKNIKDRDVAISNPFYIFKIAPYISYYLKLSKPAVLRFDTPRGRVAAIVAPRGVKLKKAELEDFGYVLEFPTFLVIYVERARYAELLERVYKT